MNKRKNEHLRKEQEHPHCSVLFDEVKERLKSLREIGISETIIESLFYVEQPLVQMVISKDYRVLLGNERKELHLEPLVKSIYLLFLKHPEGINFKDLPDYREELTRIYDKIRPWGLSDRALQSIEDVTNPFLNSINEKCSRIRSAFLNMFGEELAKNYYITGERGGEKKIDLPRNLVVWE